TVPRRIVHLWTVTSEAPADPVNPQVNPQMVELAFYSLLGHVQALAGRGGEAAVELAVVSTGVQTIDGREAVWPEKAALLGPCKVIPQEYPNLRTRAIDVVLDGAEAPAEVAARLIAEMRGESADRIVAYRGPNRWVQSFEPAPLGPPVDDKLPLRPQGTYLITGGLGGLGLVFARYLAASFQARLVLTQRSPVPPRDQWADDTSVKIRQLRALEELGAEVLVEQADAADETAMRRAVAAARERFGRIHGVIHAAGIAGGGVIQLKERATAAAVLEPKVQGVRVLESVVAEEPPDFLLLCSSITALEETVGQVDYCAANNVLDAFARYFRARWPQTRTVSVNWGPWSEVGMAVAAARSWDAGPPAEPRGEEIGHPLLERLVTSGEQATFAARLRAADHWVLSEHRILDRPTVPGATYLEMARAAVTKRSGSSEVELADILFMIPLAMNDDEEREVRTVLEPSGEGIGEGFGEGYGFRVMSLLPGSEEQWVEHVRGRAAPRVAAEPRTWDLDELIARCSERTLETEPVSESSDSLVAVGPRWHSVKRIHLGTDEAMARLELGEEFAADLDVMHLHPALLDVATSLGRGLAEWKDYLPATYRRVEFRRPLPPRFYSYVRRHGAPGKGEVLSFDVTLIAEDGTELVAIEEFSMKRVGEAAARFAEPIEVTTAPGVGSSSSLDRTLATIGIAPDEGVEALRRILSRHPAPQIAAVAGDVALFPAPR
ncbi:MAG: SDR family NAD(P)-dependent oxidoreductase, partial [bacterium]|nr:SDR family NAD(P)-dependent oxidoreductase [bacterium]